METEEKKQRRKEDEREVNKEETDMGNTKGGWGSGKERKSALNGKKRT